MPCCAVAVRVVTVRCATKDMDARASPRKPRVPTLCRSPKFRSLEVACLLHIRGRSSTCIRSSADQLISQQTGQTQKSLGFPQHAPLDTAGHSDAYLHATAVILDDKELQASIFDGDVDACGPCSKGNAHTTIQTRQQSHDSASIPSSDRRKR